MSTVNEITGDSLRSRPATKAYSDNYDSIFRRPSVPLQFPTDSLGEPVLTPREPMELTITEWDEKRMDTIGSNGNEGIHYLH